MYLAVSMQKPTGETLEDQKADLILLKQAVCDELAWLCQVIGEV